MLESSVWHTLVILVLKGQRQEDQELKASLGHVIYPVSKTLWLGL